MSLPALARQSRGTRRDGAVPVELPFPHKGVHQAGPRSKQPPGTCTDALNVVGFAPMSDRYGGGKCPGTRRAFSDQVTGDGTNRILGMAVKPEAASSTDAPVASDLLRPNGTDIEIGGSWRPFPSATAAGSYNTLIDETVPNNDTDYIVATGGDGVDPASGTDRRPLGGAGILFHTTNYAGPPANSSVVLRFTYSRTQAPASVGNSGTNSGAINVGSITDDEQSADEDPVAGSSGEGVGGADHLLEVQVRHGAASFTGTYIASIVITNATPGVWLTQELQLSAAEVAAITNWNNVMVACIATGTGVHAQGRYLVTQIEIEVIPANNPPTDATSKVLLLLKNRCYIGDLPTDTMSTAGTTALARDRPEVIYYRPTDRFYAVDGVSMQVINGNANPPTVQNWTTLVTGTGNTLPENMRLICGWRGRIVTARQEGGTPNPAFYAMSRVFDPYDWRPEAIPTATAAFLGSNAQIGQPEDSITALIPWTEDVLLFGGSKSINVMLGDPGFGGSMENVTRHTGILGARAHTIDEEGNLWFMGSAGLYIMRPGAKPVSVSGRRLYRWLDRVDGAQTLIQLAYDGAAKCVYIFLTPKTPPTAAGGQPSNGIARHLIFDIAADRFSEEPGAFWPRGLPWATMGPWSVVQITGATDDDRRFLIGGNDGYVRRPFDGGKLDASGVFSPSGTARYGTADDMLRAGTGGMAIFSTIRYAPIEYPLGARETTCVELQAVGTDNNLPLELPLGPVRWRWLGNDSPTDIGEQNQTAFQAGGEWFGDADRFGQQENVGLRVTAGCHQLVLAHTSADTSWAIDRVTAYFKTAGRRK